MGRVKTKGLVAQTILAKIFGTKESSPVKLNRAGKGQNLLLLVFSLLLPKFNFRKGDWTLDYVSTLS